MVNSVFYADSATPVLSGNTVLLNGKKNYFKSMSLGNRLLDNLQTNTIEQRKPFKDTLINSRKTKRRFKLYALL